MEKPENVDAYIAGFDPAIRERLEQLRAAIRQAAPEAQEVISYGMPAYKQKGIVVYFAAHKEHIGFYPTASGIRVFADALQSRVTSKGTVQFPHKEPLPLDLISDIVKYRVAENAGKRKR